MTRCQIIDVQLEQFFGLKFPQKIQRLVDEEMNQGRWAEGYDLAVNPDVVDGEDARKLLETVLSQSPELRMDFDTLMRVVQQQLQPSSKERMPWIVDKNGSYALTDGLRIARFDRDSLTWRSMRISFDGIEFDSLQDGKLCGRAWLGSGNVSPDSPFVMDFETGQLLEGWSWDY